MKTLRKTPLAVAGRKIRRKPSEWVFDIFNYVLMVIVIVITLYPILYVVFASVSEPDQLLSYSGIIVRPLGFQLRGYEKVFQNPIIGISYSNTIYYLMIGTTINIIMTSLAAFCLSRKNFYLRNFFTFFIIFTMFFSGGLIPTYLQVRSYGLYDSIWALVLPTAMSAMNMIIMRTAFQQIPESMEESAKLDGASDLTILIRIVIPLSMSTIAVMILFYAVGHWNSWFPAMIYLKSRTKFPLQLVLREILVENVTDPMSIGESSSERLALSESIKYATIVVATLPILAIYPFLQRYFVKGIMIGAIKG